MMVCKCCTQYASTFGKLSSGHRTGKGQFPFQSQRKAMPKNAQITTQLHSSHTLVSCSVMSNSFTTSRPLCPWDCPGQNTGVGCHFLLEGIFLAQGSNPSLLQCSWILYQLSHQGSPCFGRLFLPNNVVLSIYYVPGSAPQAGKGYTQLFVFSSRDSQSSGRGKKGK